LKQDLLEVETARCRTLHPATPPAQILNICSPEIGKAAIGVAQSVNVGSAASGVTHDRQLPGCPFEGQPATDHSVGHLSVVENSAGTFTAVHMVKMTLNVWPTQQPYINAISLLSGQRGKLP
jgi:hypothetical protein